MTYDENKLPNHIDVCIWYIFKKPENQVIQFDAREFKGIKWFKFNEIPLKNTDSHMERFMNKLVKHMNNFEVSDITVNHKNNLVDI